MNLTGLPDFGLAAPAPGLHHPFGGGAVLVLPDRLEVASRPDGSPDLRLTLVRGSAPGLPPDPYGVLEFSVLAECPVEDALTALRRSIPGVTVRPTPLSSGFLWMQRFSTLESPRAVVTDGLDRAALSVRVPGATAALLAGLLGGGAVGVGTRAVMEYPGVAARLPVAVTFAPEQLLPALGEVVAREDLVARVASGQLPIEVDADADSPAEALAAAVADRIRVRYGEPAVTADGRPALRLPAEPPVGHVRWDLRQPLLTYRVVPLASDALLPARSWADRHGVDALVESRVVRPLDSGAVDVTISANLPPSPVGALELGVELIAPPKPPRRPQPSRALRTFPLPPDAPPVRLRFAPGEPVEYVSVTYVVLPGLAEPLTGPEISHADDTVRLGPADFPVEFVPVRADRPVLSESTVRVTFRPSTPESGVAEAVLDGDRPSVAFVQTLGAGTLTLDFSPLDGSAAVRVGPLPAAALTVTPALLPGHGPQSVTVRTESLGRVAVDLLAQDAPPAETTTLLLTPVRPSVGWGYSPRSVFRPGYRWRVHGADAWSDVRTGDLVVV
ncbi:hypothetical protein [Cryptosporangium sp. NPDC051539]|uniref:hypothetical protein n=1 Tax=Cryptosporangium sp. NPDC051539 TaxID=3363962 RepID=UPI0037AE4717